MPMLNQQTRIRPVMGPDRSVPSQPTPPGASGLWWRRFRNALLRALSAWGT
jgi:hypothetical protein